MSDLRDIVIQIVDNVANVFVGKRLTIERIILAFISRGHVLIEDVPGVGKTTLVCAVAKSLGCSFKRIQFTPDLLPSDITGITVYNIKTGEFEFKEGPIMANIILADEINRSSPKTQSSLLEAMQEGQITIDGITHKLPDPFIVLATQNPIEYEGTFPLPEAQLDRFSMRISIGYPDCEEEKKILKFFGYENPLNQLKSVITAAQVKMIREEINKIYIDDKVEEYIISIIHATRVHPDIYLGCSPRGTLTLYNISRALAFIKGRDYVIPDDVKELVYPVLNHRLILKPDPKISGKTTELILKDILNSIKVPLVKNNV